MVRTLILKIKGGRGNHLEKFDGKDLYKFLKKDMQMVSGVFPIARGLG